MMKGQRTRKDQTRGLGRVSDRSFAIHAGPGVRPQTDDADLPSPESVYHVELVAELARRYRRPCPSLAKTVQVPVTIHRRTPRRCRVWLHLGLHLILCG